MLKYVRYSILYSSLGQTAVSYLLVKLFWLLSGIRLAYILLAADVRHKIENDIWILYRKQQKPVYPYPQLIHRTSHTLFDHQFRSQLKFEPMAQFKNIYLHFCVMNNENEPEKKNEAGEMENVSSFFQQCWYLSLVIYVNFNAFSLAAHFIVTDEQKIEQQKKKNAE